MQKVSVFGYTIGSYLASRIWYSPGIKQRFLCTAAFGMGITVSPVDCQ